MPAVPPTAPEPGAPHPTSSPQRRRRGRTLARGLGALAAASSLVLCGCAVANTQATGPKEALRVVLATEPPTLEPCDSNLTNTGVVDRSTVTEPLVERDPDSGDLQPKLATSWSTKDEKTWTFHLRHGVTFQDGSDFTAEDAALTINRAVNGHISCDVEGYVFGDEDLGVKVVDDYTLQVTSPGKDPILPLKISFLEVVPAETPMDKKIRQPIGTGPYEITDWKVGQSIELKAFPGYWGKQPAFKTAQYQWRSESAVRAAMVTQGEADIATGLSPADNIGDLGVAFQDNQTTALRMASDKPPLDNIDVRRAVNYAIDEFSIARALYGGRDIPAAQLVPEGVTGHNPKLTPWPYDPAKAKALIARAKAAGEDTSAPIDLVVRTGQFPLVKEMAEALQEELQQVGLTVRLHMLETSQQVKYQVRPFAHTDGPLMLLTQHGNQAGDAQFTVDQYMGSKGAQSAFGTPTLDRMLKRAATLSGTKREKAYEEVFAYQNEHVVQFAHITHQTGMMGLSPRVRYTPNSASEDELRLAEVSKAS